MRYDEVGQCYVADASDPMEGWTVLRREPWKDGVERVHVRCVAVVPAQFRMVYQRSPNVAALVRCFDCGRKVPRMDVTDQTTYEGSRVRCEACGDAAWVRALRHHGFSPQDAVVGESEQEG